MKKLVILDLDQTLIHSLNIKRIDIKEAFSIRLANETFYVYTRSYLRQFIDGLRKNIQEKPGVFKVAIWTAAQRDYAIKLMNVIWPQWRHEILFLRSYEHCTVLEGGAVFKDLTKLPLGYDSILIDDNHLHYNINTANSFSVWKIRPFLFNSIDSELRDVLSYINSVVSEDDNRFAIRPKTPNHLPFKY